MDCEQARELISAALDGEVSEQEDAAVRTHVVACRDCDSFRRQVELLHRRTRVAPAPAMTDVTGRVVTAVASQVRLRRRAWWEWRATRGALVVVALAQVALAVPMVLLGHDAEAPVHVAHEVGSFSLAVAAGLLLAAARPRLAAGMVPIVAMMAALLVVTAAADLTVGRTVVADEAPHLLVVGGFLLLWRLAKVNGGTDDVPGAWATPPRVEPTTEDAPGVPSAQPERPAGPRPLAGQWRRVSGL